MAFRYSTGTSDSAKPTSFAWEFAVPVTPFWDSFSWKYAKCILKAFTALEIQNLHLEQYKNESETRKFDLMDKFLEEKLALEEARYLAYGTTLQTADYDLWNKVLLAITLTSTETGHLERAEKAHRSLIDGRTDLQDMTSINNFASWLIHHTTKYDDARGFAIQSQNWIEKKLGRSSPQSIGNRKIIAETYWKENNSIKANETTVEIFECIDGLRDTRFAVYEESEREEAKEWEKKLKEEGNEEPSSVA
ncbi:hypothetical protein N7456_001453 [Penicillium angulare]|uniref:Uncharacterized protein n=1 Tax=Penicillium angulare TaxID=116970 RepID=A0A9W9KN43_9EURO|nr:hypothetical protein N7456_001453 [Penicillium angulare]